MNTRNETPGQDLPESLEENQSESADGEVGKAIVFFLGGLFAVCALWHYWPFS